jgi:lambda repressor-like predicted transcriptional regulator
MPKSMRILYRDALKAATASIPDIARESDYSLPTIQSYLYQRAPSPEAVRRLADALQARAEKLWTYAERLREALGDEAAVRKRPRRRRVRP